MMKTVYGHSIYDVIENVKADEWACGHEILDSRPVELDGATSAYPGHEDDVVLMRVDSFGIRLMYGEDSISFDSIYDSKMAAQMAEYAAEILLYGKGRLGWW